MPAATVNGNQWKWSPCPCPNAGKSFTFKSGFDRLIGLNWNSCSFALDFSTTHFFFLWGLVWFSPALCLDERLIKHFLCSASHLPLRSADGKADNVSWSFVCKQVKATGQLIPVRTWFSIPHFNGPPPPIDAVHQRINKRDRLCSLSCCGQANSSNPLFTPRLTPLPSCQ